MLQSSHGGQWSQEVSIHLQFSQLQVLNLQLSFVSIIWHSNVWVAVLKSIISRFCIASPLNHVVNFNISRHFTFLLLSLFYLAVHKKAMSSPLQAQWSHTVSWTVSSCGIPPSPPLKKETLTSGSTRAQHSTCTVLPRSGNRIKTLFCMTWSLSDVLKNNSAPFLIVYKVSWMNSLTVRFIPVSRTFDVSTEDSKLPSTFHFTAVNENSILSYEWAYSFLHIIMLYIQSSLATAKTCTWMTVLPFSESLSVSALVLEILIHVLKMSFFFLFFTLMEVAKVVTQCSTHC